jgi:hypothetical protein
MTVLANQGRTAHILATHESLCIYASIRLEIWHSAIWIRQQLSVARHTLYQFKSLKPQTHIVDIHKKMPQALLQLQSVRNYIDSLSIISTKHGRTTDVAAATTAAYFKCYWVHTIKGSTSPSDTP